MLLWGYCYKGTGWRLINDGDDNVESLGIATGEFEALFFVISIALLFVFTFYKLFSLPF